MLERLIIRNIALIEHLDFELGAGLNVLTGETGAGKSIIVDSVNPVSYTHLTLPTICSV